MTLFFVTQADSPFYQSEAFGRLLDFVAHNPRRCQFREVNGKRSMVIGDVPTIEEAVQILTSINKSN
jgi:transcription-repair coupling factor (superfamily II helicase)